MRKMGWLEQHKLADDMVAYAVDHPDSPVAAVVLLEPVLEWLRDMICPEMSLPKPQLLLTA